MYEDVLYKILFRGQKDVYYTDQNVVLYLRDKIKILDIWDKTPKFVGTFKETSSLSSQFPISLVLEQFVSQEFFEYIFLGPKYFQVGVI